MNPYRRRLKVGERCGVKGYIAPPALRQIAAERTEGLVAAYVFLGARAAHTSLLAESCYIQGVKSGLRAED